MKKIVLLNLLMVVSYFLSAQEIGFYLGGGLSGTQYKSETLESTIKYGGHVGLSYSYFFSPKFGIGSGVEFGLFSNKVSLNEDYKYAEYIVNDIDYAFEYRVEANQYEENNQFTALAIPIMLQYRFGKKAKFYINAGSKIIIPQKVKSEAEADGVALSGYFPDKGALITDMPQHGFGVIDQWKGDAKIEQKVSATLSLEGGMYFDFKENSRLYAGFYFDYGLTNMQKDPDVAKNQAFVSYSPKGIDKAEFNSVLSTNMDKVNLLAFGIQLKYTFGRKNIKQRSASSNESDYSQPLETVNKEELNDEGTAKVPEDVKQAVREKIKQEVKDEIKEELRKDLMEELESQNKSNPVLVEASNNHGLTKAEKALIENHSIEVEQGIGNIKITEASNKQLDKVVDLLKKYEDVELDIIGYTCDLGTEEFNYLLGMKRATSVENYLLSKGIERSRLHKYSRGRNNPLYPNTNEENRQKNRRIELKIVK